MDRVLPIKENLGGNEMEKQIQRVKQQVKGSKLPILLILLSVIFVGTAVGFYHSSEKEISIVDADDKITIETKSATVSQVLQEKNISLRPEDMVTPSLETRLEEGDKIQIQRARPVTITADQREYEVITALADPEKIVKEAGIELNSLDKVELQETTTSKQSTSLKVVRVTQEVLTEEEPIGHGIEKQSTKDLDKGNQRVVQEGENGLKKTEVRVTYEDGKESKRKILKEEVVIQPTDEVIQVGINDTVSTSRGSTRFEKSINVVATAYSPTDPGVDGTTSVGAPLKKGVIAVDPDVIPYYTKVYIPGYGFARALDTGGDIQGNRIDLAMDSRSEALNYGRRNVKIYILGR